MQSEVRKFLEKRREDWGDYSLFQELDAAEHADAARREEPVQALRRAVAELVARWGVRYVPIDAANMMHSILAELNAIIATEPDTAENRQATVSGPATKLTLPVGTPADEHIRAIATRAVRDVMPDVLDEVANAIHGCGFAVGVNGLRGHAAKLRKERGAPRH